MTPRSDSFDCSHNWHLLTPARSEAGPGLRSALHYLAQSLLQPVVIFASERMQSRWKEVKEGGGGRI